MKLRLPYLLILSLFPLLAACQSGVFSLNRQVASLFNANQAGAAQPQKSGAAWRLTPEEQARIESQVRKYGEYPASAAVFDWAVGPDPDAPGGRVGSVLVESGKRRAAKRIFELWSFRLPRNGVPDDVLFVGTCEATAYGYIFVPDSPADPNVEGDEMAQQEQFDRVMRLRQR
jgi:hypothetical protein